MANIVHISGEGEEGWLGVGSVFFAASCHPLLHPPKLSCHTSSSPSDLWAAGAAVPYPTPKTEHTSSSPSDLLALQPPALTISQ